MVKSCPDERAEDKNWQRNETEPLGRKEVGLRPTEQMKNLMILRGGKKQSRQKIKNENLTIQTVPSLLKKLY